MPYYKHNDYIVYCGVLTVNAMTSLCVSLLVTDYFCIKFFSIILKFWCINQQIYIFDIVSSMKSFQGLCLALITSLARLFFCSLNNHQFIQWQAKQRFAFLVKNVNILHKYFDYLCCWRLWRIYPGWLLL